MGKNNAVTNHSMGPKPEQGRGGDPLT